ncbi:RNA polymerase II subunit A C-terminal domain phosphatase SSU72-like [Lineus longissimus]|uniref:RNA polymerase II subunit A C-terminal domain phosphatase SSU72-like n=1 Tax=Lineus longissimus TaxID=88925 RepID=UPI002B4D6690
MSDLTIAVCCSSNMNRSMEAHQFLSKRGFNVKSYGSGNQVKLPGQAPDKPNIYDFNTTYEEMYRDLLRKDSNFYTQNGLLHMLDRNLRIKEKPQRFQGCNDKFDIVITCEERVFDQVVEDLESRSKDGTASHVLNINILDNQEEATLGAIDICQLCTRLQDADDLDDEIDEIIHEFELESKREILHTIYFYSD